MIGIFGNISDDDVRRTIMTAPQLCRQGTMLLWSRATSPDDANSLVRGGLPAAGFVELDYREFDQGESERAALGAARYDGPPQPLITGQQLFTFVR
jgi:hypothetical protein